MSTETTHIETEKQLVPALRFKSFGDEWKSKSFANLLLSSRLGGNYANNDTPNENPLIKMGNLGRGNISLKKVQYIEDEEVLDNKDLIQYGDLFFNTRNTLDLVGKVSIWRNELPRAFYNSNLMFIKFEDNFFMNYLLNSYEGIKGLRRLATGTTSVAAIYTKDLLKLKLTIASLPEQQKIASFLSAVDKKTQQLTKKKALLEDYKKGVMQQLFSGQLRFKDENGEAYPDWEEKRLGGIVEIMTDFVAAGSFESLRNNVTVYDELNHALYVRLTDLRHGLKHKSLKYVDKSSFEFLAKSNLYGGELLLANIGANVGDVYLMPFNIGHATIAPNMIVIRENINKFHSTYLFYHLNSHGGKKEINKAISGSGQPKLSKTDFKKLKLKLPSLFEQQKIASYLSSIDTKIESVNTQITQTQTFKKGLLQQLFV
jgi:type I restriction enzyme S subunit